MKYINNIPNCCDCGGPLADDWDYSDDESFDCKECQEKAEERRREREERRERSRFSPIDAKRWLD